MDLNREIIWNRNEFVNNSVIEKIHYFSEFGRWREESMANAVTLRIIRGYGNKDFYDYAKQFMQSQPAEYALGVLMEDFGSWDFRNVFENRHMFDIFNGYTNTCKGRKCLYKHSLFIINIFITKLLENGLSQDSPFSHIKSSCIKKLPLHGSLFVIL